MLHRGRRLSETLSNNKSFGFKPRWAPDNLVAKASTTDSQFISHVYPNKLQFGRQAPDWCTKAVGAAEVKPVSNITVYSCLHNWRNSHGVTSDSIAFQCGKDRRIKAQFNSGEQCLSMTIECSSGRSLTYQMARGQVLQWILASAKTTPTALQDSSTGAKARIGCHDGKLMIELTDIDMQVPLSCAVSVGQANVLQAFVMLAADSFLNT